MRGMDVAVLGGGPAGLAAAIALRQLGSSVAVYDAQHPPIDKACGEGLMPESVRLLRELGVVLDTNDGAELGGISFHDGSSSAYGSFSHGRGLGVRRTRLHNRLAARAAEVGVALHWGTSIRMLAGNSFAAAGNPIKAGFFVIATGLCSTLAAAAGFGGRGSSTARYASRQPFRCIPWSDNVEVHWGRHEQLYITPVGENEIGIALLTAAPGRRVRDALPDFPAVAERLAHAECTANHRGAVTKTRALRHVVRNNIALLGDTSGSVDAITGEGLLSAFRQAHALAEALHAGEPERYAGAHRQIAANPRRMAQIMLLLGRHPHLRQHCIAALAGRPQTFAALLRVHTGEQSWSNFAMHEAAGMFPGKPVTRHNSNPWSASLAASGHDRERGI